MAISCSGGDLLSRAASHQVSSALQSLTSVFGMGTGGASLLSPPNVRVVPSKLNNVHLLDDFSFILLSSLNLLVKPSDY